MQIRDSNCIKQAPSLKSNVWLFPYKQYNEWLKMQNTSDWRQSVAQAGFQGQRKCCLPNGWCYQREIRQILPSVMLFTEGEWMCFLPLQWWCTWHQLWSVNIGACGDAYLSGGNGSIKAYQRSVILESLLVFLLTFISRSTCANNKPVKQSPRKLCGMFV